MSYQFLKKFFGSAGAIASLIFLTPTAIAQLPPLSPNQAGQLNDFRSYYGDPSTFLIEDKFPRDGDSPSARQLNFRANQPVLQISPEFIRAMEQRTNRPVLRVSEQEFIEACLQNRQAANLVYTPEDGWLFVECDSLSVHLPIN